MVCFVVEIISEVKKVQNKDIRNSFSFIFLWSLPNNLNKKRTFLTKKMWLPWTFFADQKSRKELCTAQKMMFSIKDFFSKCGQIRGKLQIWSYLLKKSLMQNSIFCTVIRLIKRLAILVPVCSKQLWDIFLSKKTRYNWKYFWISKRAY